MRYSGRSPKAFNTRAEKHSLLETSRILEGNDQKKRAEANATVFESRCERQKVSMQLCRVETARVWLNLHN